MINRGNSFRIRTKKRKIDPLLCQKFRLFETDFFRLAIFGFTAALFALDNIIDRLLRNSRSFFFALFLFLFFGRGCFGAFFLPSKLGVTDDVNGKKAERKQEHNAEKTADGFDGE